MIYYKNKCKSCVITSGHPDFTEDMLYGKYLPNESGALYYREGFITQLMPTKDKNYLVIDNFNRIDQISSNVH